MKVQLDNPAILARMRSVCKVEKDADLARYLGETTSAVSSWKNATYPPFNACYTVSKKAGVSMEWLLTGNDISFEPVPVSRCRQIDLDRFCGKFIETMNVGVRTGLLSIAGDSTKKELERLGYLLFNETQGVNPSGDNPVESGPPNVIQLRTEEEIEEPELKD